VCISNYVAVQHTDFVFVGKGRLWLGFQTSCPACFSTSLEDLAGRGVAIGSHAQSAACAGVELPNLATSRHVGTSRLRSKTSRGGASCNDDVLVLSFQPSSPACFSTSLEDLAGRDLVGDSALEDLAGKNLSDNTSLEDLAGKRLVQ
jgi:hypothetical protein